MRDIKNKLTSGKNTRNFKLRKGKSFGYQVLGFGGGDRAVPQFTIASGGNATHTDGDYKIHAFTGPGSFVVSQAGNLPDFPGSPLAGPSSVSYLVVAGGAGGIAGGGAGGGFRTSYPSPAGNNPISAASFPVAVGGDNADSVFNGITSTSGGSGQHYGGPTSQPGPPGGAGGGGGAAGVPGGRAGGSGNTPPTSPPQGKDGGRSGTNSQIVGGGGGGGGPNGQVGENSPGSRGGNGGNGQPLATAFFGPNAPSYGVPGPSSGRWFSGGAGGSYHQGNIDGGTGGAGGGGRGTRLGPVNPLPAQAGTANTGGGGGASTGPGGAGGSGLVVIKYKYQ